MKSISSSSSSSLSTHIHINNKSPFVSLQFQLLSSANSASVLTFPYRNSTTTFAALKTANSGGGNRQPAGAAAASYSAADLLRKPMVEVKKNEGGIIKGEDSWVDWEDQILEDTVPLVGFVRMILHSSKYESGERLSSEHESMILQRLLAYHPESEKKIGCGIDYIMVGHHPDFESSRCLFIVRKNGEMVDFSYWKCIKGLIRKKYPLYADSFILQHFKRRKEKY
ncbi:protein DCL homolog, chloroplastic-like [Rutidosis leptorrhynchoides]|uniref:protein DCL homolog, chloroplastic-like n=1 Tax=Rutidosis leptorrhynchoides TaxID=125765 RepID=UPI003A999E4D